MTQGESWPRRPWWGTSLALALVCFVLALSAALMSPVIELGRRTNDTFFRLRNRTPSTSSVEVVVIDDAALAQQGRWPWSRSQLARLIDKIAAGHPRSIGLDVLLSEPSDARDDNALAAALTQAGNVILPAKITTSSEGSLWVEPLPVFAQAASGVGHVQAILDKDGVCRRLPEAEMSLAGRLPMMAEVLASQAHSLDMATRNSSGIQILHPSEMTIDYRGLANGEGSSRGPFRTISASKLFSDEKYDFRQKTVLIGFSGTGLEDELLTPLNYSSPAPGVLIQANMVDTMERGRIIARANPFAQATLLFAICSIGAIVMQRQHALQNVAWLVLSTASTYVAAYACFIAWGTHFSLGPAILAEFIIVPLGQLQHILLIQGLIGDSLTNLQKQTEGLPLYLAGVLAPQLNMRNPAVSLTPSESKLDRIARTDQQIAIVSAFQQSLLSGMRDGIAVFDEDGNVQFENGAWQEFFGVSGWAYEAQWPELLNLVYPTTMKLTQRGLTHRDAGYPSKAIDREVLIAARLWRISMSMLPSVKSVNKALCMVIAADLTPQMERDQARQQALQFITHELRTPLVSLLGFAELLQQFPEQARAAGAASVIQQESERLIALTTMFLECLKLETALPVVVPIETDLDIVIQNAVSLARPLCTSSNKKLIVTTAPDGTRVRLDAAMMTGALLNLVANAAKYGTDRTDIEVRVEVHADMITFGVHNRGPAIPREEIPNLFMPQYRMLEHTKDRAGWGIGLAFVKRVMDAHGGEVRVESNEAETCFQLLLPTQPTVYGAKI